MKIPVSLCQVALYSVLVAIIITPASGQEPTLIVENGRVIVGDGTVLERGTVIVADDRIVGVSEEAVAAGNARRIDASGKTVLPGLIDTNVHLVMTVPGPEGQPESEAALAVRIQSELPALLRAYLESGVTSVMSTSDYWPFILEVREGLAAGRLVGPRLLAVGPAIGAPGGHPDAFVCGDNEFCKSHLSAAVDDAEDARETVARLAGSGVDAIKLVWDDMGGRIPGLSPELVRTVIDEARARELPVHIHVVDAGLAAQALDWGADRLDHVPAPASEEAADAFVAAMRTHRGSAATTLLTLDWLVRESGSPPELLRVQESVRQMTQRLASSGDLLVAFGTDAPWLTPSESFQSEIRLLEEAGLSPAQIIRAATLSAAAHIGRGEDLGTLEPGKVADLIVVDGNPLEDVSMLWATELVVKEGEVVVPTLLEAQADTVQPHVIAPGAGHTSVSPMGVRTEFLTGSVSTGASQLMLGRGTLPPGHETPTHLHEVDEEVVYVLEGELTVILEGEEHTVGPGGTVFIPPKKWMALANRTEEPVVFLGVISRGEVEECTRVLFSTDADETERREAVELCKMRNR